MGRIITVNKDFEKLYGITKRDYYSKQYLTFEALEDGDFTFTFYDTHPQEMNNTLSEISYSVDDGKTWVIEEYEELKEVTTPTIKKGDKVLWKGNGFTNDIDFDPDIYCYFSSSGTYNVYGNIMSLVYGDDFVDKNTIISGNSFTWLFGETDVVSAEYLILPTTLAKYCYISMFNDCYLLTTAPELPALTLAQGCYTSMFYNCSSLTTAPELPATTLYIYCYDSMFFDCSSLNYIKMLATDISESDCLRNWVNGVVATGTLVVNNDYDGSRSELNIPDGWTILNKDGTEHVFPARDYSKEYFTIEAVKFSEVIFSIPNELIYDEHIQEVFYKLNDGEWQSFEQGQTRANMDVELDAGDILQFKGIAERYAGLLKNDDEQTESPEEFYSNIYLISGSDVKVYGNIFSLFYGDEFYEYYLDDENYPDDFACAGLFMDNDEGPKIDCSNLILSSYTTNGCYYNMFAACDGVIIPPELPALTLSKWCYEGMFYGCSTLNYVKAMFTTTPGVNYTGNWLKDVAATGTFIKNKNATWTTTGASGVPTGWTVETE